MDNVDAVLYCTVLYCTVLCLTLDDVDADGGCVGLVAGAGVVTSGPRPHPQQVQRACRKYLDTWKNICK